VIGLVSVTGMTDLRGAHASASTALVASDHALTGPNSDVIAGRALNAANEAVASSVTITRRLPWILGRRESLRHMDERLASASTHARAALEELEGIVPPGRGRAALDQVRQAIRAFADGVDERRALPSAAQRWYDRRVDRVSGDLPGMGAGLVAVGEGRTLDWVAAPHAIADISSERYSAPRRVIMELDPPVADRLRGLLPQQPGSWDQRSQVAMRQLFQQGGISRAALPSHMTWSLALGAFNGHHVQVSPGDLRRIVDVAEETATQPLQRPWWIDAAVDTAPITIDIDRAADLVLMPHTGSARAVEVRVAHGLVTNTRAQLQGGDFGAALVAAARRLPDSMGVDIPTGLEQDATAARTWAREVRTAPARQVVDEVLRDGGVVDAALIERLLTPKTGVGSGYGVGGAIVARELVDTLPTDTTPRRAMVASLRDRLDALIASSERSWHLEYGELGRARAASQLLVRVDARDAARAATSAAPTVDSVSLHW
jgi:hypothetical protein